MTASSVRPVTGETEDVVAFLQTRAFAPDLPVRRIDTHAASIFLTRDRAWKLKQPVRFDYLDFTTAPLRRAALEAELHLNRRTAPDLCIAVHAITRGADGALAIDGDGTAVDWLLEMRRFDDDALLDERARCGTLDMATMVRLAEQLQRFHAGAEVMEERSGSARIANVIDGNAASLGHFPELFAPIAVAALLRDQRERLRVWGDTLDRRAARGRVRHCHGDLHLANIAMIGGKPTPFDCLEFDPVLATTDTLYDLAFLLMDLWHRGLREEANALCNRYLDLSDDEDGFAAIPLFMSLRASVRAHVVAARYIRSNRCEDRALAQDYFSLAAQLLRVPPPRLVAVGGRSGTGKSTLARALGARIGGPPGARILRTDVLRKRLAGQAPEAPLAPDCYTAQSSAEVYAALTRLARSLLADGASVIADAAFLLPAQRESVETSAIGMRAPFVGLWLQAGEGVRLARVTARGRDASDADAGIVRLQKRRPVGPLGSWHRIAAGRSAASVLDDALEALGDVAECLP